MLFTGWEVRIEKLNILSRSHNPQRPRGRRPRDVFETETKYFSIRTDLNGKYCYHLKCIVYKQTKVNVLILLKKSEGIYTIGKLCGNVQTHKRLFKYRKTPVNITAINIKSHFREHLRD